LLDQVKSRLQLGDVAYVSFQLPILRLDDEVVGCNASISRATRLQLVTKLPAIAE